MKAEEAGADIYLSKPIKSQILISAIDELVAVRTDEKNQLKFRSS
jgi:DNA-binding response OmpR family regulator